MKHFILRGLRNAFGVDRIVCRLLAAWFAVSFFTLTQRGDGFHQILYAMDTPFATQLLRLAVTFLLFSAAAVLTGGFHLDSWLLLIFLGSCASVWIDAFSHATNEFLFLLAVIAILALSTVYFVRSNLDLFRRWNPSFRTVTAIAAAGAICSLIVVSVITCLRYKTFSSPNFDFGLFCNMFYNMKETGLPMITSERDRLLSHFAVHISPAFYFLLPLYWLFPYPETLQVGQALFLLAGVIPVVLLVRHFRLSGKTTLLIALLYAFYPALSTGCFYDIHENCFLPFFLLWTFYFFEKRKWLLMYLSAICVLSIKEDAAIYLLIFAVFVFCSERKYLHGTALAVLSVAYFGISYYLLETYGTGVLSSRFDNLIYDKEAGLFGVVRLALTNPGYLLTQLFTAQNGSWDKIVFLLQMLLPLGFLPFCSRKASRWLLFAPMLINLLSYYRYLYDLGFQYHFAVTAFLIYAMLKNLPEIEAPTRQNLLSLAAVACCCIYLAGVIPTLTWYSTRWREGKETYVQMEEILDSVPQEASVVCSSFLLAHMADRNEIYEVYYHENKPDVDYVVLDARSNDYKTYSRAYLRQGYEVYAEHEGLILILVSPELAETE